MLAERQTVETSTYEETEALVKELRRGGKSFINEYIKKIKIPRVFDYYRSIMDDRRRFDEYLDEDAYTHMQAEFTRRAKKRRYEYEDLPALMHIQHKLSRPYERSTLKHILIDEAQDFGEFHFYVLREILGCKSMTVFGDLAQGIYSFRGIGSWDALNRDVYDGEAGIVYMQKSYRTTIEIMEEANKALSKISRRLGLELAAPVLRNGQPVTYKKTEDFVETLSYIGARVGELQAEGHVQIAVIAKTEQKCTAVQAELSRLGLESHLLSVESRAFAGGISILPAYLSKGLEFEAVIIADADNEGYGESELDAKLLYISMTRAMHSLDICSVGAVSDLLL